MRNAFDSKKLLGPRPVLVVLRVETGTQLVLTGEESGGGAWRKRKGDASF